MNNARMTILVLALAMVVCLAQVGQAEPMGTAFTYQGRLIDANSPADGFYDFEFKLFDDPCTGAQQGSTIDVNEVTVDDGYFTVGLDFNDANAFNGDARWLDIGVRPGGSTSRYTTLSPRQQITPTPYALYAADSPDSDTLAQLGCEPNQVPKWNGTMWVCGEDNVGSGPSPDIGTWTVTRVIDTGQVFRGVVEQVAAGNSVDGSLVYLNDNDVEARRINFFDIVPVSFEMMIYRVNGTRYLGETLTFMVRRVELGLNTTHPSTLHANDFIFYLSGEAVDGVITVVPGPIFFDSPEPQPIGFIPETPGVHQDLSTSLDFTFDLVSQGSHDSLWQMIYGGEMQFLKLDREGLEITFSEFHLYGQMVNTSERREMVDWLNEWLRGTGRPTNSRAEILGVGDPPLSLGMEYRNVVPVSYVPAGVSSWGSSGEVVTEHLTLRADIIEEY